MLLMMITFFLFWYKKLYVGIQITLDKCYENQTVKHSFLWIIFLTSRHLMFALYLLTIGYKNKMIRSCAVATVNRTINKKYMNQYELCLRNVIDLRSLLKIPKYTQFSAYEICSFS